MRRSYLLRALDDFNSVDLKNAGYKVYPVNPNAEEISGDRCYPNVENLPTNPDVVNVVVPSKVTELIAETCKKLGIKKVWMQPGSESETAIKFCYDHGMYVYAESTIQFLTIFFGSP